MTEMIATVLTAGGWTVGVLVLVLMAALPLIERIGDR
jgi:hypothetical protein